MNSQKDNDITGLKTGTYYAENKIKEAAETIRELEARLRDGDEQ